MTASGDIAWINASLEQVREGLWLCARLHREDPSRADLVLTGTQLALIQQELMRMLVRSERAETEESDDAE